MLNVICTFCVIFQVNTLHFHKLFTITNCNTTGIHLFYTQIRHRWIWWWIRCWCAMFKCLKYTQLVECSNHKVWLYLLFNVFFYLTKAYVITNTRTLLLSRYSAFYKSLLFPWLQIIHKLRVECRSGDKEYIFFQLINWIYS